MRRRQLVVAIGAGALAGCGFRLRGTQTLPVSSIYLALPVNSPIGAEMTRRRLAARAIETVMQAHPRFAAVVLNKVNFAKNKYYYSRYYGHQYKNYYAEAAS